MARRGRKPRGQEQQYHSGWRFRDIEVVANVGIRAFVSNRGRAVRARVVRIRHLPCGAERDMRADTLTGWRRTAKPYSQPRVRQWCACEPVGNCHGYRLVKASVTKAGTRLEHRYVMEQVIGRPLRRGESVHHKNGDKTDNRPENLELWVKVQPAGQRVEDLVAYAKELLRRYEPAALAAPISFSAAFDRLFEEARRDAIGTIQ